ncbi:MAG: redoxin domain-containing protein [Candidatus Lokiarchaeota archaeon]|nr:redoxin domain-containing protein [Candidatus Lokiarchaeota archaeon]MBD3202392.1 redoxin domain-containing protein [Candidatus Lokiarchaeota archaeon]
MGKNKIKEGDPAPSFKIESFNSGMIDLSEEIGEQKLVLIFSRYFGCPICQLDWISLLERREEITQKGAKIFYITQSGEKVANKYVSTDRVDFPVIPSSKEELYEEYGLGMMTAGTFLKVKKRLKEAKEQGIEHGEYEGWEKQGPGQFVIDQEGIIIHAEKGWLDIDAILEVL